MQREFNCKICKQETEIETDYRSGHLVCTNCGCICAPIIEERSEWRTFSNDNAPSKDQSRAGGAENEHLSENVRLSTNITQVGPKPGKVWADSSSTVVLNRSGLSGSDKRIISAQREIQYLCSKLKLSASIAEKAVNVYHKVNANKLLSGCSTASIVAGCIHFACRYSGNPRTYKEIYVSSNISKKGISKSSKIICDILDQKKQIQINDGYTSSSTAINYNTRFCSELDLSDKVKKVSERVLVHSRDNGYFGGKSTTSTVAAAILFSCHFCKEPRSIKEIEAVIKLSETTIKLAFKDLERNSDCILKELYTDMVEAGLPVPNFELPAN